MRVQTLNEDDYGSCRGVCDLIIMNDTCAQVRTIILNRCKSINDFVLFLCRLHGASVHRFAGVFVYQKYKNNIKELRQNSTTPDKNTVKSNHMRVFHDKYVRSNRRLSDFELHKFHMAFTYERLHTRQWKCVCLPHRNPPFSLNSIVLRSHSNPCVTLETRMRSSRMNVISSITSNLHRQKDIAIVEGRIVSAVSKHLLFRVVL